MCDHCDRVERLSRQKTTLIARLERENETLREEIASLLSSDQLLPVSITEAHREQ